MTTVKSANRKFKWSLDFNQRIPDDFHIIILTIKYLREIVNTIIALLLLWGKNANVDFASPPGYNPAAAQNYTEISKENDASHLIIKKLWDVALGPLKQVPMNLFIMYMAGNSISIFPIMMVGMLIVRPVKALFTTQGTFKMIEGSHAIGQKFVYFVGNVVNILLALYKCQSMGLLPTHSSDWLFFVEPQTRLEFNGGGINLL